MNWDEYLSCTTCEAAAGQPCYALLAAGPQAVPSRPAARPHSSRKMRGATRTAVAETANPQPARPTEQRGTVARRTAATTRATATSWAQVARRQGKI